MADVKFTGIHHVKLPVGDLARSRGFDPVSFAIADRAAAEAWTAHFNALGVRHHSCAARS